MKSMGKVPMQRTLGNFMTANPNTKNTGDTLPDGRPPSPPNNKNNNNNPSKRGRVAGDLPPPQPAHQARAAPATAVPTPPSGAWALLSPRVCQPPPPHLGVFGTVRYRGRGGCVAGVDGRGAPCQHVCLP